MSQVRHITLVRRPAGVPEPGDFALTEGDMPEPGAGEMLVRMRVCSLDPAIRSLVLSR